METRKTPKIQMTIIENWKNKWSNASDHRDVIVDDALKIMNRLNELLEDHVRDKKQLAKLLSTDPVHDFMAREIMALQEEAAQCRVHAREFAPDNRPQDGRVCKCEDAPCCGHYEL
jgi:hypothetical protein